MILFGSWLILAYVILPLIWRHYEHNPSLADAPKTTLTSQGIPGDPLNVGLIGAEEDVVRAMHAAGWSPADPITLESSSHCDERGLQASRSGRAGERPLSVRPQAGPGV